jgi:hypothetical protein|tara:strand:- start:1079 stop:1336 length:258 start_codon:yes stop_codon:yes gene_type:complete
MKNYTNRHGEAYTLDYMDNGNIQWCGNFEHIRIGFKDNPSDLTMVDPSGGPYIANEMDMGEFGFDGKIVNGFISNENGYEIVIKK